MAFQPDALSPVHSEVMTPEPPVPTIDGMPITAVRTKHWYKADGEPNHLPTLTGAAGWDIGPTGVASARLWAVTWTAGATPPRGVRKNWREYDLTNIWDGRRRGEQRVEITVVFQEPGRRVQIDATYVAGAFTEGKWREEVGREPTQRGVITSEPAWLAEPRSLVLTTN